MLVTSGANSFMSRQWKALPTNLPGWHQYDPWRVDLPPKRAPSSRKNWRRKFKGKSRSPHEPMTITPHHLSTGKTITKLLRIEAPHFVAGSVWKRTSGHWRCIEAAPIINWFTRVNHPHVVEGWLRKNHYSFQWLPDSQPVTANERPDGNPHATVTGSAEAPTPCNPSRPCDGQSASGMALAENGLVHSSLLNPGGCPPNVIG